MSTLLLKDVALLITMDEKRRRIEKGGLWVRDNVIEMVGPSSELPQKADRVIDASGMVILPGLVNTHHHLYQTLTRALPAVQDVELFDWLMTLYPIWAELTAEAVYVSAQIGLAELVLSGCTTANDPSTSIPMMSLWMPRSALTCAANCGSCRNRWDRPYFMLRMTRPRPSVCQTV